MWHFHDHMRRAPQLPYTSAWLVSLVPKNPSPPDRPLALLVNTEARLPLRVEFRAHTLQAEAALAHAENLLVSLQNTSEPAP